jgi:hypothetical protein
MLSVFLFQESVLRSPLFSLLLPALCAVGWSANAADIKIADDKRFGDVVLEGTIVAGDYDKLRKLVEEEDCTPTYYRSGDYPGLDFPVCSC